MGYKNRHDIKKPVENRPVIKYNGCVAFLPIDTDRDMEFWQLSIKIDDNPAPVRYRIRQTAPLWLFPSAAAPFFLFLRPKGISAGILIEAATSDQKCIMQFLNS